MASVIDSGYNRGYSVDISQRTQGYIVSHRYYKSYTYRRNTYARLQMEKFPTNSSIYIKVLEFDVEQTQSGCYDYLYITGIEKSPLKICNSNHSSALNKEFKVQGNKIKLYFIAYDTTQKQGFLIYYKGKCKLYEQYSIA